ncbi:hypothetical protein [Actinokineospora sp. NBRC 105648]|uniref:AMIN-like domain-containing (lipo)protein n=1 Tax=Actinokineospora sp. NBRC 105648 TaxID=3032206 RepID=UPI002553D6BB|nr:hypothetical protein [Actinokineospora sp. NBRC 105648]
MRRTARALATAGLTWTLALTAPAVATAEPYCGITWGSTDKSQWWVGETSTILALRAGRHDCYDRLVVDLADAQEQDYDVSYQDVVWDFIAGEELSLRGEANLAVRLNSDPYQSWDPAGRTDLIDVRGYRTIRQVAYRGFIRGGVYLALGVRARLPYRVSTLHTQGQPSRLVIDVAHQW